MIGVAAAVLAACQSPPGAPRDGDWRQQLRALEPLPQSEDIDAGSATPLCRQVGGYEAYLKRTGKVCRLGPDAFNDPSYHEPP